MRVTRAGARGRRLLVGAAIGAASLGAAPQLAHALSSTPTRTNLVFNGPVYAMQSSSDAIYAGGNFSHVGPPLRSPVGADISSGNSTAMPRVDGTIDTAVADGSGGFYIGGSFAKVGARTRNNIAHILPNRTVDPSFDPDANGAVKVIAVSGATVYASGSFTSIGGEDRNRLAALDATTGAASGWSPDPDGDIRALARSSSTVYVGGTFDSIGGQSRHRLAAIDATTGQATGWDPDPENPQFGTTVDALSVSGPTVYVGGYFQTIGGQSRDGLAAVNATTGGATSWEPNISGGVDVLAISGSTVYAGGYFGSTGGPTRRNLAAFDATTGQTTSWDPQPTYHGGATKATSLIVSGGLVYAAGYFERIGGQRRLYIAALDPTTGTATGWDPNANGPVTTLAIAGSTAYAAGDFKSIGGQARDNLAALNPRTGQVTSWNPSSALLDEQLCLCPGIKLIAVSKKTVYVSGGFTSMADKPRNGTAALDRTTGALRNWTAHGSTSPAPSIALSSSTVYVGGTSGVGAYGPSAGAQRWRVPAGYSGDECGHDCAFVGKVAPHGSRVYASGQYLALLGDKRRNGLASLATANGAVTNWNPHPNWRVAVRSGPLAFSGSKVFAGGIFTHIGGQPRRGIAALSPTTGAATAWNAHANGGVYRLLSSGSVLYVAGNFTSIGGKPRPGLAALNATTASATSWNPHGHAGPFLVRGPDGSLWTSPTTRYKP